MRERPFLLHKRRWKYVQLAVDRGDICVDVGNLASGQIKGSNTTIIVNKIEVVLALKSYLSELS